MKFVIYNAGGQTVEIPSAWINMPVPYEIHWLRLFIVFGSITAIYLLFSLPFLQQTYDEKRTGHVFALQITTILFVLLVGIYSTQADNLSNDQIDIYTKFIVDALEEGQVHLLQEPSEELLAMENPYDYTARTKEGVDYLYDFAYYNGNYYVYFSILPIILIFLPYHLITGAYFTTGLACLIFAIAGVIFTVLFTKEVLKKFFPNISVRNVILASLFMLFSSFLLFNIEDSRIYEMVSILGYALVMAGAYYFVIAYKEEKVKYGFLALSCTFLALAVSARPNLLFVSLGIVPILLKTLKRNLEQKEKKEIVKLIVTVGVPYIVIGILIMLYNYLRFGSILEFGAQYQLTSYDMGKLGYRLSTVPIGLWHYLWNPFELLSTFPFIHPVDSTPFFAGFYGTTCKGVGIFALNKLMYALFLLPFFRKTIKEEKKQLWNSIITLLGVGLFMVIVITIMAASYGRYSLDFTWMFTLATLLFVLWIGEKLKEHETARKIYTLMLGALLIMSFTWNALLSISSEQPMFLRKNTVEYYQVQSSICFWE